LPIFRNHFLANPAQRSIVATATDYSRGPRLCYWLTAARRSQGLPARIRERGIVAVLTIRVSPNSADRGGRIRRLLGARSACDCLHCDIGGGARGPGRT